MNRKIYSFMIVLTLSLAIASSCSKEDSGVPYTYTSVLKPVAGSSLDSYIKTGYNDAADKPGTSYPFLTLMFSTDNGSNFVLYPILKVGEKYTVKLVLWDPSIGTSGGEVQEVPGGCSYVIDWSSSTPKPTSVDATAGTATFVLSGNNNIMASVSDVPVVAADLAGTYTVVEDDWVDFHPGDHLTVEKIDDTHVKINEYPNTAINHAPLVITITPSTGVAVIESQDSGAYSDPAADEETTSGSGSVSSCKGTIDLTLSFSLPCCGSFTGNVLSLKKN